MGDTGGAVAADALIATLREQGGERFDAAGWHYLDTMARRAAAHDGTVRRLLEEKLERAASSFAARLAQARTAAGDVLDGACKQHPHAAPDLRRLFECGDFKGLRRLCASLEARKQCASLTALVAQLAPVPAAASGRAAAAHANAPIAAAAPTLDLKTVRESRATWARLSVDKQLSQAMRQAPKNAGPINSHMLVLRALEMMQSIAPDYLSRTVSFVDTLLLLDPGEMVVPVKRKKAVPAKSAKPAKPAKR